MEHNVNVQSVPISDSDAGHSDSDHETSSDSDEDDHISSTDDDEDNKSEDLNQKEVTDDYFLGKFS